MLKKIILTAPRGFCAGVSRAIEIVQKALDKYGAPIYVNHEIVHNNFVIEQFKEQGVIFMTNSKDSQNIPDKAVFIFSAHGVSPQFRNEIMKKKFKIIDATCPLVAKVHKEIIYFKTQDYIICYIGKKNHQEVIGAMGVAPMHLLENKNDIKKLNCENFINKKVVCLSQTTLSLNDTREMILLLQQKIPHIKTYQDICYATQNRQQAIQELAKKSDFVIVIGSVSSSNTSKLVETVKNMGKLVVLCENKYYLPSLEFYEVVGISSGASVPDVLVEEVVQEIRSKYPLLKIENLITKEETIKFK